LLDLIPIRVQQEMTDLVGDAEATLTLRFDR
jgi:hypothetical protein